MALSRQATLNVRILYVAFFICPLLVLVISASSTNDTEGGLWCELKTSSEFVASMECRFEAPVHYMQMDFYRSGPTSAETPVTVVSCGESCDLTSDFTGTMELRGAPTNYTLTLKVKSVPQIHAGKYRCQAQSMENKETVPGQCSVRAPNTDVISGDGTEATPTEELGSGLMYALLALLVIPVAAAIIIPLCICKKKSCGPWKKSGEPKQSESKDIEAAEPGEAMPLVPNREEAKENAEEEDENKETQKSRDKEEIAREEAEKETEEAEKDPRDIEDNEPGDGERDDSKAEDVSESAQDGEASEVPSEGRAAIPETGEGDQDISRT